MKCHPQTFALIVLPTWFFSVNEVRRTSCLIMLTSDLRHFSGFQMTLAERIKPSHVTTSAVHLRLPQQTYRCVWIRCVVRGERRKVLVLENFNDQFYAVLTENGSYPFALFYIPHWSTELMKLSLDNDELWDRRQSNRSSSLTLILFSLGLLIYSCNY